MFSSRASFTMLSSMLFFSLEPGFTPNQAALFCAPGSEQARQVFDLVRTPTPTPTPTPAPSSPITMKATVSPELKRVSPRTNKGIFTSTKLDQEQTPLPKKSSKSKGKAGKRAPPTKTAPKAIQKATAPKKAAPSPPPHRSRAARAADRAAPARAAAVRKSVKL
ncbi:hypothetical protein HO133_009204 [Letharia lupina]|uniref:Uncharacterized protein n=1 Tax=Letharia lupina TaxID=560253 RepID=A0A8H6FFV6_9LECA|nr:uncharacterized protein HO133_009204 [Letharia lupina]KAF6226338.1 hypothetical protein HO133_009204 [Letharia lupina]